MSELAAKIFGLPVMVLAIAAIGVALYGGDPNTIASLIPPVATVAAFVAIVVGFALAALDR